MSRRILCQSCGDKWKPHPQDVREGWQYRSLWLSVKKPADHGVTVITDEKSVTEQLPTIFCDTCGDPVSDGEICLAVTMWRENPIGIWETEFGTPLPEDAAKLARTLEKGQT